MSRRYEPALDGVRGLAVALVVVFHLGMPWMSGGYVGVSVFFTLSGFLITRLLLDELDTTGHVSLGRFYDRRARRLLPAALATIVLLVAARVAGEFRYVDRLEVDLWGALLQVANWVQLAGSSSYAALFDGAVVSVSPVAHFWSLAIEEQFYLVWPGALLLLVRASGNRSLGVSRSVALLHGASLVTALLLASIWGRDVAYWATPARFGELLAGAWLAAWQRDRIASGRGLPVGAGVWGWPALGVILAAAVTWPSGRGPAYSGWMPVFALVTVVLLAALQVPGPLGRVLASRHLAWLGRISYGLYLVHWPMFLVMRRHGLDLREPPSAVLAVAAAVVVAEVSYVVVERPIREARWPARDNPGRRTAVLAATALAATAVAIAVMPPTTSLLGGDTSRLEQAAISTLGEGSLAPLVTASTSSDPSTTSSPSMSESGSTLPLPPAPSRPVRILVVGDSTAFTMGRGLAAWAVEHPDHAAVDVLWAQGLGFVLDGRITSFDGAAFVSRSAEVVRGEMPLLIAQLQPDVVVLMTTINDVADRQWTTAEGPLAPSDPRFGARLRSQYRAATRAALGAGVPHIVWVVPPVPTSDFDTPDLLVRASHLAVHDAIREVAASEPGAAVAEMDAWLTNVGHADDDEWRPDGTHLSEEAATRLASEWFGPWLIAEALRPLP